MTPIEGGQEELFIGIDRWASRGAEIQPNKYVEQNPRIPKDF